MVTKKIGKMDWSEGDVGGSDFVRLDEGSNVMRIITKPHQFYISWTEDSTGQKRKLRSALENCPLAERGEKLQARWFVGVLNRKSGKAGILEIGQQIFKQIKSLSEKKAWGDPRHYDLDITRNPKGSQPLYTVSPMPKEELTPEDKRAAKEFVESVDLAEMSKPPTREEVLEQLGESSKPAVKGPSKVSNDFDDSSSSDTGTSESTSDDDDFDFDGV